MRMFVILTASFSIFTWTCHGSLSIWNVGYNFFPFSTWDVSWCCNWSFVKNLCKLDKIQKSFWLHLRTTRHFRDCFIYLFSSGLLFQRSKTDLKSEIRESKSVALSGLWFWKELSGHRRSGEASVHIYLVGAIPWNAIVVLSPRNPIFFPRGKKLLRSCWPDRFKNHWPRTEQIILRAVSEIIRSNPLIF